MSVLPAEGCGRYNDDKPFDEAPLRAALPAKVAHSGMNVGYGRLSTVVRSGGLRRRGLGWNGVRVEHICTKNRSRAERMTEELAVGVRRCERLRYAREVERRGFVERVVEKVRHYGEQRYL